MIKSRRQQDISNLVDLHCDPSKLPLEPLSPTGGPLTPEPKKRQPYDSLYVKLKQQRDSWSRN